MPVGLQPLSDTGLVAFPQCGHWWVYPTRPDVEQMHELARFNLGIACSFCLADLHAAMHAWARGMLARKN